MWIMWIMWITSCRHGVEGDHVLSALRGISGALQSSAAKSPEYTQDGLEELEQLEQFLLFDFCFIFDILISDCFVCFVSFVSF
jgi:hypothetical protein